MKVILDPHRLSTQLIAAFIAVVLLSAAAVGIPAIWLLQNQIDRQAWAQVEQGQRAAIALYDAQERETISLATLTAQRPTLHEMLLSGDEPALTAYLHTLQSGAGLTSITVCTPQNQLIATTAAFASPEHCSSWKTDNYHYDPQSAAVCLTAHQTIETADGILGEVFVCDLLDDDFASLIRDETGLEHTIWLEAQPLATSFAAGTGNLSGSQPQKSASPLGDSRYTFEVAGVPYYATSLPLAETGLSAQVALDVTGIHRTRDQLARTLAASIVGVAFLGSALGVLLSRRISRPLVRLAQSAAAISRGDLQSAVDTRANVREVVQVAQALESARADLLATLTTLQTERDWSEHLLASIVEGIITLDGAGRITFFSHGAARITGWARAEVLGQPCDDIFHLADGQQIFTRAIPEPGQRGKADVFLADGRVASLAITRAELAPSEAAEAEIALVFRDISEEEAVHRILGHFLANVAHEFRTPLAALAASIELLLDQAPDLPPAELHELLNSCSSAGVRSGA